MEHSEQLNRSWREAADDLGIEVETSGEAIVVLSFGRRQGTLCWMLHAAPGAEDLRSVAKQRGMFWSELSSSYLRYDRDLFIDTLNDWGWCGEKEPPSWYTGKPWSE